MNIKNPTHNDIPFLKKMWQDIFGDTDSYIQLFFERKFSFEDTFIIEEDGKICSMLYSFPCKLQVFDQTVDSQYLCGIATKEEYRKLGYSSMLIEHAFYELKNRGKKLCFLIPANEGLFQFYKRFGMEEFTYLSKNEIIAVKNATLPSFTEEFDYEKLDRFYRNRNQKIYVSRSYEEFLTIYQCYENLMIFEDGYLLYSVENEALTILEHTFEFSKIKRICEGILNKRNLKKAMILSPFLEALGGLPFTAAKFFDEDLRNLDLNKNSSYINLMLN